MATESATRRAPGDGAPASGAPMSGAPTSGTKIGRYVVLDRIGAGGMGVVYAAYDPELDRKVALKVLHRPRSVHPERVKGAVMNRLFGDPQPEPTASPDQGRLLREAQAAAKMSDPHVVTVHDVGEHEGAVFIAMEFVQGRTLGAWLREHERPWRDVLRAMLQAAAGLIAAHDQGLVHRDFKPENVMIDEGGRVRVMDFGLVRSAEATPSRELQPNTDALGLELTHEGAVMGTPAYMSPEQYLGVAVGPASDQFSFCAAVWEGLYGERPFAGPSLASLATAVTSGQRRDPPAGNDVPAWIRRALERGLATEPVERHASMRALVAELQRDPTRRRRSVALGLGVLLLGAAAFGARQVDRAHTVAACEAEGRAIREVWDDAALERVRAAITASGVSYGETAVERTRPWLDEWADEWQATREEACRASADTEGPQPAATIECLDARRTTFEAAIEVLGEPDPHAARRAVGIAAGLQRPSSCLDPKVLARRPALPADPEVRAQAVELEGLLARAIALEASGKFEPARELVLEVIERAEPLSIAPLTARARFRVGTLHERNGDYEAAERELAAATLALAELGRDDDAALGAMRLAVVLAERRGRYEEGLVWGRWAEVLVARAGAEDGPLGAQLHAEIGLVMQGGGAYDEALVHLQRALELEERDSGPGHPSLALALNNLGSLQSTRGEYDVALELYERALAVFEASLGADHPDTAMPLVNMAEIHWRRGRLDAAEEAMRRGLAIQEAAFGAKHPRVAQSLSNLGLLVAGQGRTEDAIAIHERALAIVEAAFGREGAQVATVLGNLGDSLRAAGRVDDALAAHERAVAIHEATGGPARLEMAEVLASLGNDRSALDDHQGALTAQKRALEIVQQVAGPEHPYVGRLLVNIGEIELALGRESDAVRTLENAVAALDRDGADPRDRGAARLHLARALPPAQLGRARELAIMAVELLREAGPRALKTRAEAEAWLAAHPGS